MPSFTALAAVIPCLASIYYLYIRSLRLFPPGPRGLPFFGCVLSMPKEKEWLTYTQWARKYGVILGLNVIGHKIVVLNTPELAAELLDRRGGIYSDRPKIPMLELLGLSDWSVGLMPYGNKLRTSRKLLLQAVSQPMLKRYASVQEREVYKFLKDVLDESPNPVYKHLKRALGAVVMSIFLGHRVTGETDFYANLYDEHIAATSRAGSFSTYLVNTFPALKYLPTWFPGAQFKIDAEEGRYNTQEVFDLPMKLAKQRMSEGSVVPCFMNTIIESGENVPEGQSVAATVYTAGVETTAATLATFVLAMILYPDVQKKAQDEVARVLGTQRLPRLEDRERLQLPFVEAVIKETFRWYPTGNLGVPHCLMKDDEIDGYLLPRGTILLPNVWAILHDEKRYSQPLEFRPERYLVPEPPQDPRDHLFGYGRRACPGMNFADAIIWLTVVSLLSAVDISHDTDENGEIIPVVVDYTSGVMSRPKDFRCSMKPRYSSLVNDLEHCIASLENPEAY